MKSSKPPVLETFSHSIGRWISTSTALICVSCFLLIWLIVGPFVHFEESWHIFITSSSAAITLFMVFVLTRSQAKDTAAMQIKLDEIIAALETADNNLINSEKLSESEIKDISEQKRKTSEDV